MNRAWPYPFLAWLTAGAMLAPPASACAVMTWAQAAAAQTRALAAYREAVGRLGKDADLIFVGRITRLEAQDDPDTAADGRRPVRRMRAAFSLDSAIKGDYRDGDVLRYAIDKNRVWVGCRSQFWQLPKEDGLGRRYLVYAKDGTILRTNTIYDDPQEMTGWEEAKLARESNADSAAGHAAD